MPYLDASCMKSSIELTWTLPRWVRGPTSRLDRVGWFSDTSYPEARAVEISQTNSSPEAALERLSSLQSLTVPPITSPGAFINESYEVYEPLPFTTRTHSQQQQQQPQQQAAPNPAPSRSTSQSAYSRSSSALATARRLLRRPRRLGSRLSARERAHIEDAADHPRTSDAGGSRHTELTSPNQVAAPLPDLSEAHSEGEESTVDDPYQLLDQSYWPQRTRGVSPRTSSAIFWALEEGLRKPYSLTPDWDELNASMSDLPGTIGSMPGGSVRMGNGASRASQGPVPVQTHQPSSGVRTPTEIMRQRRDREARKKAEQEAKDLEQEAARRRVQQEQYQQPRQTQPQPQYYAANNGARAKPVQRRATVSSGMPPAPGLQHGIGTTPGFSSGYVQASPANAGPRTPNQQQHGQPPLDVPLRTGSYKQPTGQTAPPNQQGAPQPQPQQQSRRSTFPHAFERWETLSSHWEGLTSYWLRKLQQNGEALDHNTVNQQMARQITDLSAAGANLFHAVVELQRLRASSERKFQRWFFETRAEQERAREVQAELERQLQAERQNRTDTLSSWQRFESEKLNNSELLKEMRRELQISKEEARRAWEELGRREQEERDRTRSLQDGHPTLVGGVQVVPMIQGFGTRQNSANRPPTREGPYPGGPGPSNMGGQSEESAAREAMDPAAAGQYYEAGSTSSTETDPFPEDKEKHPMISPSTAAEGSSQTNPSHFYQQNPSAVFHPRPTAPEPREGAYNPSAGSDEPEDDEYPQYGRDVLYPPTLSDESDDFASFDSSPYLSTGQVPLDYSGSGWGPGWDPMTPRYRHPNAPNLSVVLEEDERSRTTPSRASPASRSLASRSVASRSLH